MSGAEKKISATWLKYLSIEARGSITGHTGTSDPDELILDMLFTFVRWSHLANNMSEAIKRTGTLAALDERESRWTHYMNIIPRILQTGRAVGLLKLASLPPENQALFDTKFNSKKFSSEFNIATAIREITEDKIDRILTLAKRFPNKIAEIDKLVKTPKDLRHQLIGHTTLAAHAANGKTRMC